MPTIIESVKTLNGNSIELYNTGKESAKVLAIGVFHGDEPQGKYLIERFLKAFDKDVSMLFIPCLNPDGLTSGTRTNSRGVDLNRNFPTLNWGKNEGENATCDDAKSAYYGGNAPASEIETKFLVNVIEKYKPKLILTIHAPYKVVNYDGPAKEFAEKISEIIKYPVEASIGYPTPGSFGTYCGVERNLPVITLELDEEIPVENLIRPVFKVFDYLSII